ncbi:DUF6221 family protein [Streptomyces sp. CA2R106]|uniref:DUF6221 family protein n=1 Tax=Streptomyces sp. CA2R106 TaxID=3120153 RepID=UPI00300B0B3F
MLRETEAKQGGLRVYDQMAPEPDSPKAHARYAAQTTLRLLRPVLCHLARAYADHPDYRADEWVPEI